MPAAIEPNANSQVVWGESLESLVGHLGDRKSSRRATRKRANSADDARADCQRWQRCRGWQ